MKQLTSGRLLRVIHYLPELIALYSRLFWDRRVPLRLKLMLVGGIAYFLVPFDVLPEIFVPPFGFFDDLVVLLLTLRYFVVWSPPEIVREHILAIQASKRR